MKKRILLLITGILLLSIVGCDKVTNDKEITLNTNEQAPQTTATTQSNSTKVNTPDEDSQYHYKVYDDETDSDKFRNLTVSYEGKTIDAPLTYGKLASIIPEVNNMDIKSRLSGDNTFKSTVGMSVNGEDGKGMLTFELVTPKNNANCDYKDLIVQRFTPSSNKFQIYNNLIPGKTTLDEVFKEYGVPRNLVDKKSGDEVTQIPDAYELWYSFDGNKEQIGGYKVKFTTFNMYFENEPDIKNRKLSYISMFIGLNY